MMTDLIEVTVARPHQNEFGDSFDKATGESYLVPISVALGLFASGWIEDFKGRIDVSKNDVPGRQGTGPRAGAAGKGGNAQNNGTAGA
jgi:hypothetical protein